MRKDSSPKRPPRPHKRPSQARSQFTVQTLYDAFVRIWSRSGPEAVTMRTVAEASGYAVGTLYEYFPNREALLSGYVRHCLEDLCRRMLEADGDSTLPWRARLRRVVGEALDENHAAPYFDSHMVLLESTIADGQDHQKAFTRLCETWQTLLRGWPDLPPVDDAVVELLLLNLWGGRRYAILLGRRDLRPSDIDRTAAMVAALLAPLTPNP